MAERAVGFFDQIYHSEIERAMSDEARQHLYGTPAICLGP